MTAEQFSAIVRETQGGFRRYLVALCCGDRQLADDVAQEAYVKAYLSIDTLRDSASFAAWLRRIGYNVFVSQQRGTVQAVGYDHPEAMQSPSASRADDAFRYEELYEALGHLSAKERTSVLLYYMEGYEISEVAAIVGATPNAVKQHLSRGRMHLRSIITKNK